MDDVARTFARWRNDALAFARECVGMDALEAWQIEALAALSGHDRLAIRSGHGVGKTTFDAIVILWFGSTRGDARIPCTAPVADQLKVNLFGEIRKWRNHMEKQHAIGAWLAPQIQITDTEVKWENGNLCVARTARPDNPEALAGQHATNMLFLIDEASGVDEAVFEVALGALSTPGAKQILTGNPTRPNGYFFNCFHKNRAMFWTRRVSSEEVPRARGHIEDVIKTYGRDSNAYRVRVEGEFPTGTSDQLIGLDVVEAARGRKVSPMLVRPLWGLDIGYRTDRSVLSVRRGNIMPTVPRVWQNFEPMQLAGAVYALYQQTSVKDRPSEILIDALFEGRSVAGRLREYDLPARAVNVAETASAHEQFFNLRTEIAHSAKDWFEARDCSIPADDGLTPEEIKIMEQFIAEVTAFKMKPPTSTGKAALEKKDEVKKVLGVSPDIADSFFLTFAGVPVALNQLHAFKPGMAVTEFNVDDPFSRQIPGSRTMDWEP